MWSNGLWTNLSLPCLLWRSHKDVRRAACGSKTEVWRYFVYTLVMIPCLIPFRFVSDVFQTVPDSIGITDFKVSRSCQWTLEHNNRGSVFLFSFFIVNALDNPSLCNSDFVFCIYLFLVSHRTFQVLICISYIYICRSQGPRGLRRRSAAARLLRSWVRIPPGAWMFVCCECCVLSGRGLCDELITRPEESYRLWCVVVCDLEKLKNEEVMTRVGSQRHSKKKVYICILIC